MKTNEQFYALLRDCVDKFVSHRVTCAYAPTERAMAMAMDAVEAERKVCEFVKALILDLEQANEIGEKYKADAAKCDDAWGAD